MSVLGQLATPNVSWSALAPQIILMVGGVLLLTVVSLIRGSAPRGFVASATTIVAVAAIAATVPLWHRVQNASEGAQSTVGGAIGLDGFSLFATWVLCVGLILAVWTAEGYLRREGLDSPEPYVLMLLSTAGGVVMASANDLIAMFVGLEILSIAAYVLAASHSRRHSSREAGFKYFVLGGFASAFLVYGIAFVYGAAGSTSLVAIRDRLAETVLLDDGLLLLGIAFLLVGFGFKVAAVPFHMWTPDVYQGAPIPVAGFMASVVKTAAFAGLVRVIVAALGAYRVQWQPVVFVLAVASLAVGAFGAMRQDDPKRILAYSSINHAGFMLVGVEVGTAKGTAAVLFYLASYTFMVVGSFATLALIARRGEVAQSLDDLRGLSRRRPGLALAFAFFLLAQAGTPFTAGFLAKFSVIGSAVDSEHWAIAVVAMLSAVVSAFVYLRVVATIYFGPTEADNGRDRSSLPLAGRLALGVAVVGTLGLGLLPKWATDWSEKATVVLAQPGQPDR